MERPSVLFRISSVIFRCQKYVKKGYMKMTKKIYLEPLKSVLGQSILHYCWLCQILPITTGILVIDSHCVKK